MRLAHPVLPTILTNLIGFTALYESKVFWFSLYRHAVPFAIVISPFTPKNTCVQKVSDYRLVRLTNGVYSVHSLAHGETFHPVIGPVAEAEALYIRQLHLPRRFREHATVPPHSEASEFVIWDVGFGAAANALTVLKALRRIPGTLRMISFDVTSAPVEFALQQGRSLEYLAGYESHLHELIHSHEAKFMDEQLTVHWTLHLADFPAFIRSPAELPEPHAILFDAFSPAKNPDMWTQPLFADLYRRLGPNRPCAMPTYSRSTMLRVSLLLAGFYVGSGHPTGEKEETTLAANTLALIDEPLERAWLVRARRSKSAEPLWTPHYRQAPMSSEMWERLNEHPQFRGSP